MSLNSIINGKGVNLKILEESDVEQIREWRNSKEVSNFMLSRDIISKDQQAKWYNSIKNDKSGVYWIILSKEGVRLGLASLTRIDYENHTAEPGLYIGAQENRNSFFGMEAYFHLLSYGFKQLQLDMMFGTVLSNNTVAIKMNTSFGYVTRNVIKNEVTIDGTDYDVYKLELYKDAFYSSRMTRFFSPK